MDFHLVGRMGCTVAHDHPGTATNFALGKYCRPVEGNTLVLPDWAVQSGYDLRWGPCRDEGGVAVTNIMDQISPDSMGVLAAHDMGFYEALLSLATLLVFLWLDRKPRVPGFYPLMIGVTYGPARFMMDFLRPESTDHRDFFFTPGQWGALFIFVMCAYLLYTRLKSGDAPVWAPYGTKPELPADEDASPPEEDEAASS